MRSAVMVLGANGLLGQKLAEFLSRGTPHQIVLADRQAEALVRINDASYRAVDITDRKSVRETTREFKPRVIINAAAVTDVDACETERETTWKTNVTAVDHIIESARRIDATVVHVSTDYVFDGKEGPYAEDARPNPINYYGKSKLASENLLKASEVKHLIVRTMVLFGTGVNVRSNFALWLVKSLDEGKPVRIVDDQSGNPTLVDDLAHGIVSAVELEKEGLYHMAGREISSRYDFALKLAEVFGFDPSLITPIKTDSLKQSAARPLRSGLITLKAEVELGYKPSTMEEGLMILRSQLSRGPRRLPDSAPVPGKKQQ